MIARKKLVVYTSVLLDIPFNCIPMNTQYFFSLIILFSPVTLVGMDHKEFDHKQVAQKMLQRTQPRGDIVTMDVILRRLQKLRRKADQNGRICVEISKKAQ
jgi:hypothetical protein